MTVRRVSLRRGQVRPQPVWTTRPQAVALLLRGATVHVAAPVALAVGTVLSLVNHGGILLAGGASWATWVRSRSTTPSRSWWPVSATSAAAARPRPMSTPNRRTVRYDRRPHHPRQWHAAQHSEVWIGEGQYTVTAALARDRGIELHRLAGAASLAVYARGECVGFVNVQTELMSSP